MLLRRRYKDEDSKNKAKKESNEALIEKETIKTPAKETKKPLPKKKKVTKDEPK